MSKVLTDMVLIDELLNRSIDSIYPSRELLRNKLLEGNQLKVYVGIDPTADYVHLGHSTNYIILKRLHGLGHKIIVLVGDFTAIIGDPSDKTSMRTKLTKEEVEANLKTFRQQIGRILNFEDEDNPIEFKFNSEWLAKLTFEDAVELASNFTLQQMVERDAFQKRITDNKPLYVHEFFYPLMQGYDSVAMDVDIEVGGTDQTFNMLAGRTLLKRYKDKEKFVITTTLLENPTTGEKLMSKSLGTGIGLNESPAEMFGKTMALPDEGILQCFVDCTYLSMDEIKSIETELKEGANPRDIKLRLASIIVEMYHDKSAAEKACSAWTSQFSGGNIPKDIPEFKTAGGDKDIIQLLSDAGLIQSKSEGRRLLEEGAVRLNGVPVKGQLTQIENNDVLQAGKRRFIRIISS